MSDFPDKFTLPPKAQMNILVLICCSAFLSTGASVAGGLVMYVQSISVLEKNIENLSECEVRGLVEAIMRAPREVEQTAREMLLHYMSVENTVIKSPTPVGMDPVTNFLNVTPETAQEWADQVRWYGFSRVLHSGLSEVGLVLQPFEDKDPSSLYTHVWYDILADRSTEFVVADYYKGLEGAYNVTSDPWVAPRVLATSADSATGVLQKYIYNFTFDTYQWADTLNMPLDGDVGQYTSDTPTGGSFLRGPEPFVMHRWRKPSSWYSSDNNPYVYQGFDLVVKPPPPPHPWHGYKQIWFQCYFVYTFIEDTMLEYRDNNKDATLVLYDGQYDKVYAATTGEALMNKECWSGLRVIDALDESCVTRLANMSRTVQDAWRKVGRPFSEGLPSVRSGNETTFAKRSLGGENHFVRVVPMFSFTPENGVANFDLYVLWMSPESVIRSKIDEALTLLIVFAVLVFTVDVVLTVLEVVLVARPLAQISASMVAFEDMKLDDVASQLLKAVSGPVCVKEVYLLCEGVMFACRSLQEFKAFLPATLFAEESDGACSSTDPHSNSQSNTGSIAKGSETSVVATRNLLKLGLSSCRGTLVKVTLPNEVTGDTYGRQLEVVKAACEARRGVLHGFLLCAPEVVYVSWNLASQCVDHVRKACGAAVQMKKLADENMAVAVVKGVFKAGNLGTKNFRAFAIHGEESVQELEFAHVFVQEHVEALGTTVIVATQSLVEEAVANFAMHIVGRLEQGGRAVKAYEVAGERSVDNDEWMYQLQEVDGSGDPLLLFFASTKPDVAAVEEATAKGQFENLTPLQRRCYEMLKTGKGRVYYRRSAVHASGTETRFL